MPSQNFDPVEVAALQPEAINADVAAALAAFAVGTITGGPVWFAIARTGAWINLFNLLPIWQLDGNRGLHAVGRAPRWALVAVALVAFLATHSAPVAAGAAALRKLYDNLALLSPDEARLVRTIIRTCDGNPYEQPVAEAEVRAAFPGDDISDRPQPEERLPGLLELIDGIHPSGRYLAADLQPAPA